MKKLKIDYDDTNYLLELCTKRYDISDETTIKVVFDKNYCNYIRNPDLHNMKDGYYTFIIHDDHELKIAPLASFENGCKHIQLVNGEDVVWVGGELKKDGDEILYNLCSGLFFFTETNTYNQMYNKPEMTKMLYKTFIKHKATRMKFVNYELIVDDDFIRNGLWKLEDTNPPINYTTL